MRERIPAALAFVASLFVGLPLSAADPVPPGDKAVVPKIVASPSQPVQVTPPGVPTPCDVGKFIWLDVSGFAGDVSWDFSAPGIVSLYPEAPPGAAKDYYPGVLQGESANVWHKAPSKTAVPCLGVKEGSVTISAWGVSGTRAKKIAELTVQVGPRPPPKPDDPKPKPDEPDVKPVPVTSFRVFLVYESAQTMTQAQTNVLYGNVVEEYLNAKCTGGKAGWRRRDKDADGDADATMAALWKAVKPKLTTVPCVVIEVNGNAEIIPLEATPAAMVAKLDTYFKGVK